MIGFEYYNPARIVFGEGSENKLKDLLGIDPLQSFADRSFLTLLCYSLR